MNRFCIICHRSIEQLVWSELLITNLQIAEVTYPFSSTYYIVASCFTLSSLSALLKNLLFQIWVSEHTYKL